MMKTLERRLEAYTDFTELYYLKEDCISLALCPSSSPLKFKNIFWDQDFFLLRTFSFGKKIILFHEKNFDKHRFSLYLLKVTSSQPKLNDHMLGAHP
jgi:hypothetical protein